jgi:DNA-binding MarR family transcriptional regulator
MTQIEEERLVDVGAKRKTAYLEALSIIEVLHRRLLDGVKYRLDRSGCTEINSAQALLLHSLGDEDLSIGELVAAGHYRGTNVSYNVKKLTALQYLEYRRSDRDQRSVRVRLTEKGLVIHRLIDELYSHQFYTLSEAWKSNSADFEKGKTVLRKLERFWYDQIRFRT